MQRPVQHQIDERGELQMRAAFARVGWAVSKIEKDYGIDFEVQVFDNSRSTDIWFKVQLKSSGISRYSASGDFVSEELEADHARYYAEALAEPIILIHCDVKAGKTLWHAPQLDPVLSSTLAGPQQKSISVRVLTRNELPASVGELARVLGQLRLALASRAIINAPVPDFLSAIKGQVDEKRLVRELQMKIDVVSLRQAQELFVSNRYKEALNLADEIILNPRSPVETKFGAILERERDEFMIASRAGEPQGALPQIRLQTGKRLQNLTKNGPRHLKFYALIARTAAELQLLAHRSFGLYMNFKGHYQLGNGFWVLHTLTERAVVDLALWRKFNQCIRLVRYAANSKYRGVLARALLRVVEAVAASLIGPRDEGRTDVANAYASRSLEICKLVAWIAMQVEDEECLSFAITAALMLTEDPKSDAATWALDQVEAIQDAGIKAETAERTNRQLARLRGEDVPGTIQTTEQQIFENMATAIGVDLLDKSNPLAQMVYQGIQDRDPTAIFRHCEHAYVGPGMLTFLERSLGGRLGLPIGPKVIYCTLHNEAVQGDDANATLGEFKSRFCASCQDHKPRAADWECTDEWLAAEQDRRREFTIKFHTRKRGG